MVQAKAQAAAGKRGARDVPDRIGKYVINHSFLVPGLVSTTLAVAVGLLIGSLMGIETPH